jgi:nucleoside-diphosphate-sugar epimerase
MKALVTGGSGFIGSHLIEALLKKNYEVSCLVMENDDLSWIKDYKINFVKGDVTDKNTLYRAVKGVDYIYHLAAVIVTKRYEDYHKVNFNGTKNIVEACIESGVKIKRFLFVSSIAAAGPTEKDKIYNEEKEGAPISDYGRTKLEAEKYLKSIDKKVPFSVVRLPLMYGPRDRGAIFSYFQAINKGVKLFMGSGLANICFVRDAVNGMILAAENEIAAGKTYLVAQPGIFSREEIAGWIEKAVGRKAIALRIPFLVALISIPFFWIIGKLTGKPALFNMRNYNDLKYGYWKYSTEKIEKELGFKSEYNLESGTKITAEWYKKNKLL